MLETEAIKLILRVTCSILQNNFYYSEEALHRFLDIFERVINESYEEFEEWAEEDFLLRLKYDHKAREDFTCQFMGVNIANILYYELFFTDEEMDAFDRILSKYIGDRKNAQSRGKRAHN